MTVGRLGDEDEEGKVRVRTSMEDGPHKYADRSLVRTVLLLLRRG